MSKNNDPNAVGKGEAGVSIPPGSTTKNRRFPAKNGRSGAPPKKPNTAEHCSNMRTQLGKHWGRCSLGVPILLLATAFVVGIALATAAKWAACKPGASTLHMGGVLMAGCK